MAVTKWLIIGVALFGIVYDIAVYWIYGGAATISTEIGYPGDWIIKGVKGEFYPCKPDIFAATYEAAEG